MEMRNPLLPKERKEYRLAEKLRRLRGLRGLTQKEVAQAASIDESTVRNYELVCFATLFFRFSQHIFFGFHVFRQRRASDFPSLRICPS